MKVCGVGLFLSPTHFRSFKIKCVGSVQGVRLHTFQICAESVKSVLAYIAQKCYNVAVF